MTMTIGHISLKNIARIANAVPCQKEKLCMLRLLFSIVINQFFACPQRKSMGNIFLLFYFFQIYKLKVGDYFLQSHNKDNEKDDTRDFERNLKHWLRLWQLKTWIHDSLCYLTIKRDTGQHSQFLIDNEIKAHCHWFLSILDDWWLVIDDWCARVDCNLTHGLYPF